MAAAAPRAVTINVSAAFVPSASYLGCIATLRAAGVPLLTDDIAAHLTVVMRADSTMRYVWKEAGAAVKALFIDRDAMLLKEADVSRVCDGGSPSSPLPPSPRLHTSCAPIPPRRSSTSLSSLRSLSTRSFSTTASSQAAYSTPPLHRVR